MVIMLETQYTSIQRVQAQTLDVILKEMSTWSFDNEEREEFEDILRTHSTNVVHGGYEFMNKDVIPCIIDLIAGHDEGWGISLGFIDPEERP